MSLRAQLMLVSLLLLSLPWAGCQFIREVEGALRQGQEQSLQASARAVAAVLGDRPELLYPDPARLQPVLNAGTSLYASPARETIIMDGYADGWDDEDHGGFSSAPGQASLTVSYQARTRDDRLYLLLRVRDPEVIYHNPGLSPEPNGDRLVLRTWQDGRRQEYTIATAAPGQVRGQFASARHRGADAGRLRGYWQDAADGYTLELEMPLSLIGERLGFYVTNVGRRSGSPVTTVGNTTPLDSAPPPWLIHSPPALREALAPFAGEAASLEVIDREGWVIGEPGEAASTTAGAGGQSGTFWLLRTLYRSVLAEDAPAAAPTPPAIGKLAGREVEHALAGEAASGWYRDEARGSRTWLAATAPVRADGRVIGAVVMGESSEEYLSLTDQAFSRLLLYSLVALGGAALGLLGYASILSFRIGHLSRAAARALENEGTVPVEFPRSAMRDEVGELSRNYASLLAQVREYNEYLRTLSRKLAHELRTPIAVIQSSLDNLEPAPPADAGDADVTRAPSAADAEIYRHRAREGLRRLNRILVAMSEASRLEESIRGNPLEAVDLAQVLREVTAAYRSLYPGRTFHLTLPPGPAVLKASPDLLVQALDKLVDNANGFCPSGGTIDIDLAERSGAWTLSVSNPGPPLPADLAGRLFEPMVSLREPGDRDVHLGMGLHVVRLIVEHHGGRVEAANLPDDAGAVFTLILPHTPYT